VLAISLEDISVPNSFCWLVYTLFFVT